MRLATNGPHTSSERKKYPTRLKSTSLIRTAGARSAVSTIPKDPSVITYHVGSAQFVDGTLPIPSYEQYVKAQSILFNSTIGPVATVASLRPNSTAAIDLHSPKRFKLALTLIDNVVMRVPASSSAGLVA
jgi:hypothetical protein